MNDRVDAGHGVRRDLRVDRAAHDHPVEPVGHVRSGLDETGHRPPLREQPGHHLAAEPTTGTGDEDATGHCGRREHALIVQ